MAVDTEPPSEREQAKRRRQSHHSSHPSHTKHDASPLPYSQLAILAVIALAEQTALNSFSPYLPQMASRFPEVDENQVGLYVGLIASSFAFAQFTTNFFWGWLSDRVGRKPVVLTGTLLTAACFVAFGYCQTLWQAILVQVLMGLVNGNQGVVSTCLGEITDRSNQSKAFIYLPVVYGIGAITGPLVGGLLTFETLPFSDQPNPYPYLAPNLLSAGILVVDMILTMIFLKETLQQAKDLPPLNKRVEHFFVRFWQFYGFSKSATRTHHRHSHSSSHANYNTLGNDDTIDHDENDDDDDESMTFLPAAVEEMSKSKIFTRDTVLLLGTFLIFQLANISYNSLYPIFGSAAPPTGRGLSPEEIGLSLGFAGLVTIVFQVGLFGSIRDRLGNKSIYRAGLSGMVIAFALMPFVGYRSSEDPASKFWLWAELGGVLVIKTISAVACLTSALLLITNSAPDHSVLGRLNGLAQTLSAAGRTVGPFVAGGLFSASTTLEPRGEALAFGTFAGITAVGVLLSFGIRTRNLETEEQSEDDSESTSDEDDYDDDERIHNDSESSDDTR